MMRGRRGVNGVRTAQIGSKWKVSINHWVAAWCAGVALQCLLLLLLLLLLPPPPPRGAKPVWELQSLS